MEIRNAKIEEVSLGFEGHGILTIGLTLDYGDGGHQGFGGYALGGRDDAETQHLHRWICGLLKTVGVDYWRQLEGKYVRVEREEGWVGKVLRIGNVIEDKWFDPINAKDGTKLREVV
jgi:hypothetical protein